MPLPAPVRVPVDTMEGESVDGGAEDGERVPLGRVEKATGLQGGELERATKNDAEPSMEIVRRINEVAKKRGLTMAQVSLLWVLNKDPVAAPVIGTTKLKNLEDLVAAVREKLTDEEMKYLEEPYKPMGSGKW